MKTSKRKPIPGYYVPPERLKYRKGWHVIPAPTPLSRWQQVGLHAGCAWRHFVKTLKALFQP